MSDLKYQDVAELTKRKVLTEFKIDSLNSRIGDLRGKQNNEITRLEWINKYIEDKTPLELTMADLSEKYGRPVKIVEK